MPLISPCINSPECDGYTVNRLGLCSACEKRVADYLARQSALVRIGGTPQKIVKVVDVKEYPDSEWIRIITVKGF